MPAHRTPTPALRLNGTAKHNKARYEERIANEATDEELSPLGAPPEELTKDERAMWLDIANTCIKGTVFAEDRYAVTEFARVMVAMSAAHKAKKLPSDGLYKQFFRFIAMFGLSPADRSRVKVERGEGSGAKKPANPFSQFADS